MRENRTQNQASVLYTEIQSGAVETIHGHVARLHS